MNEERTGLVFSFLLDGQGGGQLLGLDQIEQWDPAATPFWMHFNRKHPDCETWIREQSGLDPLIAEALLEEETRPRCAAMKNGILLILRSVNSRAGSDPEDMISIRMWIEPNRVITLRSMPLDFVLQIRDWVIEGAGPKDIGELLTFLVHGLNEQMEPVLVQLSEQIDTMEDETLDPDKEDPRERLSDLRRRTVILRRYVVPQREAVARLLVERAAWLNDAHRQSLGEAVDSIKRFVEDMDMIRERSAVIQDEIARRSDERMNRNMYWLSLIAAIFLPLSFITGLLGINVGGIPGTDHPLAFEIVCGLMVILAGLQIILFRKLKIF